MRRIIPLFIFFASIAYLFYGPRPMDKIGETVKTRNCYKLRLMDQERISLPSEKIKPNNNPTASIQQDILTQNRKLTLDSKQETNSLAFRTK